MRTRILSEAKLPTNYFGSFMIQRAQRSPISLKAVLQPSLYIALHLFSSVIHKSNSIIRSTVRCLFLGIGRFVDAGGLCWQVIYIYSLLQPHQTLVHLISHLLESRSWSSPQCSIQFQYRRHAACEWFCWVSHSVIRPQL